MRTLERWQVNYIRHRLVKNYTKIARSLNDESSHLFKKSALRDIALEYPRLLRMNAIVKSWKSKIICYHWIHNEKQ